MRGLFRLIKYISDVGRFDHVEAMITVGASEAETHLSALLDRVAGM
jgi:hypothetical protein